MKFYKYKSVDYIEDVLVNQRLYCSKFDELNDPMEWAFTSENENREIEKLLHETKKDSWRICCLSRSEQYGLMWSMYADSHRGVCIEVEVDIDNPTEDDEILEYKDGWFYGKIAYIPNMTKLHDVNRHDVTRVLWNKSKQWEHEQEFRFIHRLNVGQTKVFFPVKINKVYLGNRMDSDTVCYIEKICKSAKIDCVRMTDKNAPSVNFWNDNKNTPFAYN